MIIVLSFRTVRVILKKSIWLYWSTFLIMCTSFLYLSWLNFFFVYYYSLNKIKDYPSEKELFPREERKEQPEAPVQEPGCLQYNIQCLSCHARAKVRKKSQTTPQHSVSINQPGRQTGARTISWGRLG